MQIISNENDKNKTKNSLILDKSRANSESKTISNCSAVLYGDIL
jgi:hypothetical protein